MRRLGVYVVFVAVGAAVSWLVRDGMRGWF